MDDLPNDRSLKLSPEVQNRKFGEWLVTQAQLIEAVEADECLAVGGLGEIVSILPAPGGEFLVRVRFDDHVDGRTVAIYGHNSRLIHSDIMPDEESLRRPMTWTNSTP